MIEVNKDFKGKEERESILQPQNNDCNLIFFFILGGTKSVWPNSSRNIIIVQLLEIFSANLVALDLITAEI